MSPEQIEVIEAIAKKHGPDVAEALFSLYESIAAVIIENEELKEQIKELERQLSEAI